jgi:hypothetical protein
MNEGCRTACPGSVLPLGQVALVIGGHWPVVDVVFEYESHVRLLLLWAMGTNRDLST